MREITERKPQKIWADERTEKRNQIAQYLAKMFDDDFRLAKGFYLGHAENIMQIVEA